MRNALPVYVNLKRRGIDLEVVCPVCQTGEETFIHLFKDCAFARLYWAVLPLPSHVIHSDLLNLSNWVLQVKQQVSRDEFNFFVASCWSKWSNRNKIVHEEKGYDAMESVQFVQRYLIKYREARHQFNSPRSPESEQRWCPPRDGVIKINYDASIRHSTTGASIGVVARDHTGRIVAWKKLVV